MSNLEPWREYIETLNMPDEGEEAPEIESIVKKKRATPGRKFMVQKIVTEIYVYTDIENHAFAESTFQELFLLGEMTEAKLNRILSKRKREQG